MWIVEFKCSRPLNTYNILLSIVNARELRDLSPILLAEEKVNQQKRCTLCTPSIKLEKKIGVPHARSLGRTMGLGVSCRDKQMVQFLCVVITLQYNRVSHQWSN